MSYPARNYPETEHKDYDAYGNPKIAVQHQQPVAMQSMSLDAGLSRDEDGKRAWKNGLFDIANDLPTFLVGWCLPCIPYGHNKARYAHLTERRQPHPQAENMFGETLTSTDTITHGLLHYFCCAGWIFEMGARREVRERYAIRGTPVEDCLTAAFCTPCALTQESHELAEEERMYGNRR